MLYSCRGYHLPHTKYHTKNYSTPKLINMETILISPAKRVFVGVVVSLFISETKQKTCISVHQLFQGTCKHARERLYLLLTGTSMFVCMKFTFTNHQSGGV